MIDWAWRGEYLNWAIVHLLFLAIGTIYVADYFWRTTSLKGKSIAGGAVLFSLAVGAAVLWASA